MWSACRQTYSLAVECKAPKVFVLTKTSLLLIACVWWAPFNLSNDRLFSIEQYFLSIWTSRATDVPLRVNYQLWHRLAGTHYMTSSWLLNQCYHLLIYVQLRTSDVLKRLKVDRFRIKTIPLFIATTFCQKKSKYWLKWEISKMDWSWMLFNEGSPFVMVGCSWLSTSDRRENWVRECSAVTRRPNEHLLEASNLVRVMRTHFVERLAQGNIILSKNS